MGHIQETMEHGWRFYILRDRVNLAVYVINNIPYVWVRMSEAGEREAVEVIGK